MPKLSVKGNTMPASPIRRLVPYAEAAKKRGTKVYHLNIGQPDIKTPAKAIEAVKAADLSIVKYSHSAGFETYRRKLVDYYAKFNISISHEDLLVTTGGSEALLFTMLSCFDDGDEIIIPEPFYANYNGFSNVGNVKVVPITAHIENGFALPAMEAFEKVITPKTKAILICNPSNPTGYLYSKEELEQLRTIVKKHDLFLIVDEVYREFCYDGQVHTSVLSLDGLEDNAIVVDSISKRYSACGARIGALVSKNKDFISTAMKFAQARLSPPTLAQILAEATLDVDEHYITASIAEYDSRRKLLVKQLNEIPGIICPTPGGAFYTFVQLPIDNADKFCQWMLEEFSYEGETVMMAPGTGFYASKGVGMNQVRFAYVLNKEDLSRALVCLAEGLKAYPGRTI